MVGRVGTEVSVVRGPAYDPRGAGTRKMQPEARARGLLLPREHGAWGIVILPFLAGAVVAGEWLAWRTLAALLTVLSVFSLRDSLIVLFRNRDAGKFAAPAVVERETRSANLTLTVCLAGLAGGGGVLLAALPAAPVLLLGSGGAVLLLASVFFTVRNAQRSMVAQLLGVAGLTSSSLVAYLAVRGHLETLAFAVWGMSAVHACASILVVRARLESIIAHRKPGSVPLLRSFYRRAAGMQVALWSLLGAVAVAGNPWLLLPFLAPSALHWWELWQFWSGKGLRLSLQRVGLLQLGASLVFYCLLIAVLRR